MQNEILSNLKVTLKKYDREGCVAWAKKAVEEGVDALMAIDALTKVMEEIGDGFNSGDLFLPELIGAGRTMEAAMSILNKELVRRRLERKTLGKVVIGTVFGDLHNIGKDMVSSLLTAGGFTVYDLGINVETSEFIAAVRRYHPDILALSALLTTTAREQKVVIDALKKEGLRNEVKVIVGGGAIDERFARSIESEGYAPTAPLGVKLSKSLIGAR